MASTKKKSPSASKGMGLHNLPKRDAPTECSGDVELMLAHLVEHPNAKYTCMSASCSLKYSIYSAKTLTTSFKKGYYDITGWVYVNDVVFVTIRTLSSNGVYRYKQELVDLKTRGGVVFDFDKVEGISTIDEMQNALISKGLPPAPYIVLTSPNSFHVWYRGVYGFWTQKRKFDYAFKFIGEETPDQIGITEIRRLSHAGIDYNYLVQDTGMSKIRIPGSINMTMSGPFVTQAKYFKEYDTISVDHVVLSSTTEAFPDDHQDEVVVEKSNKNYDFYAWYANKVEELVSPFLLKKNLKKFSDHLTRRLGLLSKGTCQLSQTEIANAIGVTQPSVSRILKNLIKAKILIVMDDGKYHFGAGTVGKARTYGAGEELEKIFKSVNEKEVRRELSEPYEQGAANEAMLKDIRTMYKIGFKNDDIVRVCSRKMAARGKRRKSDRSIRRAVERWDSKADRRSQRPDTPLMDPNSILLIVGGKI